MSYPDYTHDGKCINADPLNLIFRDFPVDVGVDVDSVDSELARRNWTRPIFAWNQHLHTSAGQPTQDRQRVFGNLFVRYHVRLWRLNREVIANAHHEYLSLGLGNHVIVGFEEAERLVGNLFESAGWNVTYDTHTMNNFQPYPFNNGKATIATRLYTQRLEKVNLVKPSEREQGLTTREIFKVNLEGVKRKE